MGPYDEPIRAHMGPYGTGTETNENVPCESISTACARPDMPAKVKTALRTLLLSTSDVPGTEGRKTQLRFDGHGNNLLFGAASFFVTPNFADTYSPLVDPFG